MRGEDEKSACVDVDAELLMETDEVVVFGLGRTVLGFGDAAGLASMSRAGFGLDLCFRMGVRRMHRPTQRQCARRTNAPPAKTEAKNMAKRTNLASISWPKELLGI